LVALIQTASLVIPARGYGQTAGDAPVPSAPSPPASVEADYEVRLALPINVIIAAPTRHIGNTNTSEIFRFLEESLRRRTNFTAMLREDPRCAGLACFVEKTRDDYSEHLTEFKREDKPDELKTWGEVSSMLRSKPHARYLILLSSVAQADETDRLTALLVDTNEALRYIHEARARKELGNPEKDEALDDQIAQWAVKASPPPMKVRSTDPIDDLLRKLVEEDFKPVFEQEGHWEPYGSIAIVGPDPGLEIEIDGAKVGTTKPSRTVIGKVLPGSVSVKILHPDYIAAEQTVQVERGRVAELDIAVVREPLEFGQTARTGVLWAGVGLTVIGAAIAVFGLARASGSELHVVCVRDPNAPECKGGSEWLKFGGAAGDESIDPSEDINRGNSIGIVPMGYSLALTGLTWSLTTALIGEDDDVPWLQVALGVLVFVGAYGLSMQLEGTNAVKCQNQGC
jgi:hypothetical protein